MRQPISGQQLPTGGYEFAYEDGTKTYAPASEYAATLAASLPASTDGALAQNPYTAPPPTGNPYLDIPMPAPVASDATGAGGAPGAPVESDTGAGGEGWWERTYAPGEEPITPATGGAPASGTVGGLPSNPRYAAPPVAEATTEFGETSGAAMAAPAAPRYAPATRIPGGRTPASWTTAGKQYGPGVLEGYQESLEGQQTAAQMREMAARDESERQIKQSVATREALAYQQDQIQKAEAERAKVRADAEAEIKTAVAEVGQEKINPDAYWESKSGFQRVLLALALGLNAAGGRNDVAQMINARIAENIDAQKTNIGQKRASIEGKVNVYNRMLDRFGDEAKAEQASYASYLDQVAKQAELNAAQFQQTDPIRAARSMELAADFRKQQADIERQLTETTVQQHDVMTPDRIVGGGMIGGSGAIDPKDPTAGMSKQDAAKYRELAKSMRDHVGALSDLRAATDAVSSTDAGTGVVASRAPAWALSSEGNRVRGKITNAIGRYGKAVYGAMTSDEFGRAKETATGSGTQEETINGLATLTNGVRASVDNELKQQPAHIQEAFKRAHPDLFPPTVSGRKPGQ